MNAEVVVLALIAALSPFVMAWQVNRSAAKKQEANWEREDRVAERAAEAAEKVAEAAALLVESNVNVAASTQATNDKLDVIEAGQQVIHALVNSAMTTEIEGHRAALVALAVLVPLESEQGQEVAAQIAVLNAALADRAAAAEKAAAAAVAAGDATAGT